MSSGIEGAGTLVFLRVESGEKVRFGLDEWGGPSTASGAFAVDPDNAHTVELFIGSLAVHGPWPAEWAVSQDQLSQRSQRLNLWLDGHLVWMANLHLPFNPAEPFMGVGENIQGFTSAAHRYEGVIRRILYSDAEKHTFLMRNLREP